MTRFIIVFVLGFSLGAWMFHKPCQELEQPIVNMSKTTSIKTSPIQTPAITFKAIDNGPVKTLEADVQLEKDDQDVKKEAITNQRIQAEIALNEEYKDNQWTTAGEEISDRELATMAGKCRVECEEAIGETPITPLMQWGIIENGHCGCVLLNRYEQVKQPIVDVYDIADYSNKLAEIEDLKE